MNPSPGPVLFLTFGFPALAFASGEAGTCNLTEHFPAVGARKSKSGNDG